MLKAKKQVDLCRFNNVSSLQMHHARQQQIFSCPPNNVNISTAGAPHIHNNDTTSGSKNNPLSPLAPARMKMGVYSERDPKLWSNFLP